ncbi:MAG: class I SAM-dependent methyltransferase [Phycisphaerae bacterium]|nr:class I SAM-dependent methyltransferase [Phycisphaerae bacterium]
MTKFRKALSRIKTILSLSRNTSLKSYVNTQEAIHHLAQLDWRIEALETRMLNAEAKLSSQERLGDFLKSGCFTSGQARTILQMRNQWYASVLPTPEMPSPAALLEKTVSLEEALERLEELAPAGFPVWQEAFHEGEKMYEGLPVDSCSLEGHAVAELFRLYLQPYLRGNVLDIGCGPQPIPRYLQSTMYPCRIHGLDPLGNSEEHPFDFYKGVAEFLPWESNQFDAVVVATSLDHVFLLDRSLEEIRRVLKPDGCLLLWVAFVKDAKPYDPYAKNVEKVDPYHLFHFDLPWFRELLERYYTFVEFMDVIEGGQQEFCVLKPKS